MMNSFQHTLLLKIWTRTVFICIFLFLTGCVGNHIEKAPASRSLDNTVNTGQTVNPGKSAKNTSRTTNAIDPTVVTYPPEMFKDPLEFVNRPIFVFNDFSYRYALIPVSKGYLKAVPKQIRSCASNVFSNIREPLNTVNHIFQLNGKFMLTSLARLLINSTAGLLGLFDPADAWLHIEERRTDLNDTLAVYGAGYGLSQRIQNS